MAKLYFIGSGEPTPTKYSCGTCYVLRIEDEYVMFDCGTGSTSKMVHMDLLPTQIDNLFFTHHHFDHNVDYPAFLLVRWDQSLSNDKPLRIWGPPPTEWITDRLIGPEGAFRDDLKARIEHPASHRIYKMRGGVLPRPTNNCIAKDVKVGDVIENKMWKITIAEARHVEPWLISLAYRIDWPGGSLVVAGDTGPCKDVTKLASGADTLVAHSKNLQNKVNPELEEAIFGAREAGRLAQEAGVKRLVLSHQNIDFHKPGVKEKGIAEAAQEFSGEIVFAEELTSLEI